MGIPSVHTVKATAISANSEDDEDEEFTLDDLETRPE